MASILIIEDEENLRFSVRQALTRAGHEVAEADAVEPAWDLTRAREFDAVLTDVNLGGESGIDLVKRLRDDGYDGVVVVMTAYGTVENAVAAMKLGADDYLQKPVSLEELVLLTERLLEHRRVRRRLSLYQRLEAVQGGDRVGVIGESPVWKETLRLAERLAAIPVQRRARDTGGPATGGALPTILILGETGTGKGMLARHIHETGAAASKERGDAPYVHINCSALPPTLIESELFGHEKGAFTDAKAARAGLFEMAEGGTVFLDEIGDMPLDLQAKLLTVVEDGIYRRVGGSRDKSVSARVIAATNQDLEKRVEDGKFRRDLLYRLNAFTVRIPALRERSQDAVLMAEALLSRFQREYGRTPARLSDEAREAVRRHRWPGNVRELINACQRVAMLCDAEEIAAEDLGLPAPAGEAPAPKAAPAGTGDGEAPKAATGRLMFDFERGVHRAEEVERELIVQALERTRGNVSKAAKLIGMQRSSFRYRIDRFELHTLVEEMAKR